jgi:hypothetical protein
MSSLRLDAMCVDLAVPLDCKRYSMLDLPVSYTKEDLTAVLQKACDREDDAYFQIDSLMQEGVKVGPHQCVDYYGIRGGSLIWSFNAPVKVTAQLANTDKEPVEHDLWLRQIERDGAATVKVDPNDTAGIKWLADNGYTQSASGYVLRHDGRPLMTDLLQCLAYYARTNRVVVNVSVCNNMQVLIDGSDGTVHAITAQTDDTIGTIASRFKASSAQPVDVLKMQFTFGSAALTSSASLGEQGVRAGDILKQACGGLKGGKPPSDYMRLPSPTARKLRCKFADMSQPGDNEQWSDDAPDYRIAEPGLCLEGKCRNDSYDAHDELVIMNNGIHDFDLIRDNNSRNKVLVCPLCSHYVKATTCGVNNCVWRMTGENADTKIMVFTKYELVGDWYYTFENQPSVEWTRLLIQVTVTATTFFQCTTLAVYA